MDRALKERTVGAIVLMVFIVLVVPVFLDGPEPEAPVVSESVTLPGQNGQPRRRQTIVLERNRTEPVPVGSTAGESQPAATATATTTGPDTDNTAVPARARDDTPPEPAADETPQDAPPQAEAAADDPPPAAEPEPAAPAPAAAARSATGMWAVQLGSFSNRANAERLASELRGKGYAAFLSQLESSGGPLHRVRIGPQKDRDGAEAMASRLAADGHRGQVVPHP